MPSSIACSTSSFRAGSSFKTCGGRRWRPLPRPVACAQRAASIATLPPPTTATRFAVHDRRVVLSAAISLHQVDCGSGTRWRSRRPCRFSPGMLIKLGQTRAGADKHGLIAHPQTARRSSSVLPMTMLVSISTPSAFRLSISCCTMAFGRRNSGMPYTKHAARNMQRLKHGDFIAHFWRGRPRRSDRTGPEPIDGNAMAVVRRLFGRLPSAFVVVPVGDKALQTADRHRLALDAAHAVALALRSPAGRHGRRRREESWILSGSDTRPQNRPPRPSR